MKKLLLSLFVGAVVFNASAISVTKSAVTPNNNGTNLVAGGCVTTTFTFINTNLTVNCLVTFFDAPSTSITYSNASYSSIAYTSASITNIYTNYFNVPTTNIYTALVHTTNTVAAGTNNFPIAFNVLIPSNTPSGNGTVTLNFPYTFNNGIVFTNQGAISVTANFSQ